MQLRNKTFSKKRKGQVAVEFSDTVAPEEQTVVQWDLQHAIHHKLSNLKEMALASLDMIRVYVPGLEGGKKQFGGAGIITVGTRETDWHAELFKQSDGGGAGLIRCIVQEAKIVVAPVWPFLVELGAELAKEDADRLIVGVGLKQ